MIRYHMVITFFSSTVKMNTVMVRFSDTYLDRGFPLKSAISKALQNLMLSGISGMSAREKKEGGGDENQHSGHGAQEVWVAFCEMNHLKLFATTAR